MQPPADASGGFMLTKYTNGTDVHHQRIHLPPFTLDGWTGAAQGGATVDYGYTASGQQGTEGSIAQTWVAWVTLMKVLYNNAWTFTLDELYQIVNGAPVLVPIPPNPTAIQGSGANASSLVDRFTALIYNFRTRGGHRGRVEMIGGYNFATFTANDAVSSTTEGAYLTGAATAIVAHDGTHFLGPGHQTVPQLAKVRRKLGQA